MEYFKNQLTQILLKIEIKKALNDLERFNKNSEPVWLCSNEELIEIRNELTANLLYLQRKRHELNKNIVHK